MTNAAYLAAARVIARVIARHAIVRSVTLRRSIAAGEARFGRSDIDLDIVLHSACATPAEARQLSDLNRTVRRLGLICPWLGQCGAIAFDELAEWAELESFRVGLDLDHAVLLEGEPFEFTRHPITPEQAAYRTACWFENYLPRALRSGNCTNLWKFTLEMWTTCNLGLGRTITPHLRRSDTLAEWHLQEPQSDLPAPDWPADRLWLQMMALTAELHSTLLAPLGVPAQPLSHSLILPPSFARRTLLVGTAEQIASRIARLPANAIALTPEALGLYLEYINPALFGLLPPEIQALGFQRPSRAAWQSVLRRWSFPFLARKPGFGSRDFGTAPRYVLYAQRAAATLGTGDTPAPIRLDDLGPAARSPQAFSTYFIDHYPEVLAAARRFPRTSALGL
ncbi:MAG: hypothetical protein WEB31_06435 [Chthoniobacterales bacterium]